MTLGAITSADDLKNKTIILVWYSMKSKTWCFVDKTRIDITYITFNLNQNENLLIQNILIMYKWINENFRGSGKNYILVYIKRNNITGKKYSAQ